MSGPLLQVRRVRKAFGGVTAVADVSFDVEPREIRAVIGPNGAGKTTLFNLVSGLLPLDGGTIRLTGTLLNGLAPAARAALGLARTFQNLQIFSNMTVLENVMVGRHLQSRVGLLGAALGTPAASREEAEIVRAARACLAFVGLEDRALDPAGSLAFGQQRLLEIARTLAMEPRLVLLDEPAAGLNPAEVEALADLITTLRAQGYTILIVEHHMDLVMRISDRVLVLDHGEVLADGRPDAVQSDPAVIDAYLGIEELHA